MVSAHYKREANRFEQPNTASAAKSPNVRDFDMRTSFSSLSAMDLLKIAYFQIKLQVAVANQEIEWHVVQFEPDLFRVREQWNTINIVANTDFHINKTCHRMNDTSH